MEINRVSYNKICEQWSDFRNHSKINSCIVDFLDHLKPDSAVLDVGCGTGYPIAAFLSEHGCKVTGIDISENMIEKARQLQLQNASFIIKDILDMQTSQKFDGVIAFDSLWHIAHEKQKDIYKLISALLKPGGYFLFTHGKNDCVVNGKMFGEEFYYSALDINCLHRLLQEAGFRIVSSIKDYAEETTGDRELLILAQKIF